MKITLIQVGKTKQSFVHEAESEYLKRLQLYAKIETILLKESVLPNGTREAGQNLVKTKEGQEIIAHLPKSSFIIVLTETGKSFTSVGFAQFLKEKQDTGDSHLTFIIGGPYGLAPEVLAKADLKLSFSAFTFTHEIIRMLLLEQIYRAFTIIQGKIYHY